MTHLGSFMRGWWSAWMHTKELRLLLMTPYVFVWAMHDMVMRRMRKLALNSNRLKHESRSP